MNTGVGESDSLALFRIRGIPLSGIDIRPVEPPRGIIVALHGGGSRAGYWNFPANSLLTRAARRGYRAVAIDRPGYGAAAALPMPLADQAEVVLDLVTKLRDRDGPLPVLLAGHSMGGILTLVTGANPRSTELLSALDASGVPLIFPAAQQDALLGWQLGQGETHFPALEQAHSHSMFFGPDGTFDPAALAYASKLRAPVPGAEMPDAANAPRNLPAIMRRIELPTRLTFAELERSSIASAEVIAAARADLSGSNHADVRIESNTGHNISLHHGGGAFHDGMIDWLEATGKRR